MCESMAEGGSCHRDSRRIATVPVATSEFWSYRNGDGGDQPRGPDDRSRNQSRCSSRTGEDQMMRSARVLAMMTMSVSLAAMAVDVVSAQTPARDPSARLKEVLPADVAARVLATIADARAHDLPAAALENRALKSAGKGVAPADIERSVNGQFDRMKVSKDALQRGRGTKPTDDEVDAGA